MSNFFCFKHNRKKKHIQFLESLKERKRCFLKINWKNLIIAIAIPLAVGVLSALLTRGNMILFDEIVKPPLSPPGWLFPVVWTALYTLMGIASYIIYELKEPKDEIKRALTIYKVQLLVNFFWSIIFFNLRAFLLAFYWIILLLVLIILNTVLFWRLKKVAGALLIPYFVWVTFAAYLTYGIYLLN